MEIEWRLSGVVNYQQACAEMQARALALARASQKAEVVANLARAGRAGGAGSSAGGDAERGGGGGDLYVGGGGDLYVGGGSQLLWLLEHPAMISLGRTGKSSDVSSDVSAGNRLPIVLASRGGMATYHGPGQRIVYFVLRLKEHADSVRGFVRTVEAWVTDALAKCGLQVLADQQAIGLWVDKRKIVAMGFRVSRGIVTHGVAINREVDLSAYQAIVPCGLDAREYGVSSMFAEGCRVSQQELDDRLWETCPFLRSE